MPIPVKRWRLALAAISLFLCAIYFLHISRDARWLPVSVGGDVGNENSLLGKQQAFWRQLYPHILENEPLCPPVAHSEVGDLEIGYEPSSTKTLNRPDRLNISTTQLHELRSRHRAFSSILKSAQYVLPYVAKSRGIVTTAGGKYLPVAAVSIRMLRETGCELPVEIFLATQNEWDSELCDKVFPQLNSRCVVLADIFDPRHPNEMLGIHKYQYKIMSVVFSSFEEVLFIDSDCFPIYDPTEHFASEPFSQTGMVLWPDFWYPSESPSFFDIAEITIPDLKSRPATESGELLYSKPKHTNSLLLALYYNFYGPDFYYPLQSQGAPGEGDKETFLWSAVVFDEPFYSVHQRVKAMGYVTTNSQWRGSAMAQHDPVLDLHRQNQVETLGEENVQMVVRPLFVHVNFPKIDPGEIFQKMSFGANGPTKDDDGTMRRIWHKNETEAIDFFGFDVERRLWYVVRDLACGLEGKVNAWNGLRDVCKQATEYWDTLFGSG